jgi:hypothetical protein
MKLVCTILIISVGAVSAAAQRSQPRTAWGDPDLQGTYTNTYESGTSFERSDRWEGDTLVVETTNFKERSVYRNANPEELKVTERFSRTSPSALRWTVALDDLSTWMRPWTSSMPLTADDNPVPAYECHEGNYGLRNILSAARAEERQRAR